MRIISNKKTTGKRLYASMMLTGLLLVSGCGSAFDMPYTVDSQVSSFRVVEREEDSRTAAPFAADLCVVSSDVDSPDVNMEKASGAGLFDVNRREVLYAKNVHEQLYPASLTKVMTALVALQNGSGDMMLTASANVTNLESGAQVCGLKEGDQMTLSQALHVLLIQSANDAAVMIAEGIAGSQEAFAEMMNAKALAIGATNTHFVNPHGLSDENHYTTVYDMYLIMNEAIQYDLFNEIIHMSSYETVYTDKNGKSKELSVHNSNFYLQEKEKAPEGVTVTGGKTGTTNAAGHCLTLLAKDTAGNPYISVILRADSRDELYTQMTDLLEEINN